MFVVIRKEHARRPHAVTRHARRGSPLASVTETILHHRLETGRSFGTRSKVERAGFFSKDAEGTQASANFPDCDMRMLVHATRSPLSAASIGTLLAKIGAASAPRYE